MRSFSFVSFYQGKSTVLLFQQLVLTTECVFSEPQLVNLFVSVTNCLFKFNYPVKPAKQVKPLSGTDRMGLSISRYACIQHSPD